MNATVSCMVCILSFLSRSEYSAVMIEVYVLYSTYTCSVDILILNITCIPCHLHRDSVVVYSIPVCECMFILKVSILVRTVNVYL